jgi:hypothetical protein
MPGYGITPETYTLHLSEEIRTRLRLERIFMPYASRQREMHIRNGGRFVHYTSADTALKIIKGKRLWMRSTTCMTDFTEVNHGYGILREYFRDGARLDSFVQAFDAVASGVAMEAIQHFDRWTQDIQLNTYITSVSEHSDSEDLHGRLSMWRAFGGTTSRVAIILKVPWYSDVTDKLHLIFSPVAYIKQEEIYSEMNAVTSNIQTNRDYLRSVPRDQVVGYVFAMLLAGVTCLKHEGFHEEREWRVIYSPKRVLSPIIESAIEVVGGVPQVIYKLPMDESVSDVVKDVDISKICDRVIIGPSPYPSVMRESFVQALSEAGVPNADSKVWASTIPIRA